VKRENGERLASHFTLQVSRETQPTTLRPTSLIDFILNLAALLLWLSWRSRYFDPLNRTTPATLVGTLRRAEPRRWQGWQLLAGVLGVLLLRAWIYWAIGSPADWTPKLDLGLVVLAFRSDRFLMVLLFSILSFLRTLIVFYFWLLVLVVINRNPPEPDPIQKLIRMHLGRAAHWPWPLQVIIPVLFAAALWLAFYPVLAHLGIVNRPRSLLHLLEQGLLIGGALFFNLKFLLPPFLVLHLIASYVYLGSSPVWDFVSNTARNILTPLRGLPLHIAKLDLAPLAGLALVLLLLHWLPSLILLVLDRHNLTLWPQ
jgi:uncharacterized protein YggT (Ycf19 family)